MKIGFYGTECRDRKAAFSCMTYGFSDTEIDTTECRLWQDEFEGVTVSGKYEICLDAVRDNASRAKAVIVFVMGCGGENDFITKISKLVDCPIVGGTAAAGNDAGASRLSVLAETASGASDAFGGTVETELEAALFIITDEGYEFSADFSNIHEEILSTVTLELVSPRRVSRINGIPAAEFMRQEKEKLGLSEDDCEHLTLCTRERVNAHMNYKNGAIIGFGRDLEEEMLLCYADPKCVQERMEHFFMDDQAIVFGCAGLRGILDHKFTGGKLGAFLFGEILTVGGHGEFGNLMLSKLTVKKR